MKGLKKSKRVGDQKAVMCVECGAQIPLGICGVRITPIVTKAPPTAADPRGLGHQFNVNFAPICLGHGAS